MNRELSAGDIIAMVALAGMVMVGILYAYDSHRAEVNGLVIAIERAMLWPFTLVSERAQAIDALLARADPGRLSAKALLQVHSAVSGYARWAVAALALVLAAIAWRAAVVNRYTRHLDLDRLARELARDNPCVRPIIGLHLLNSDPDKGPWRYARTPLSWSVEHGLILGPDGKPIPRDAALDPDDGQARLEPLYDWEQAELDEERARALFLRQLGRRMPAALDDLEDYELGLAAAFCAFAASRRDEGQALLDRMSTSWRGRPEGGPPQALDITGAHDLIAKTLDNRYVQTAFLRHGAWVRTALVGLLEQARARSGKLPPAEFIWLRPTDRTLWYALHSVGGDRVCYVEGAGVLAHMTMEREIGRVRAQSGERERWRLDEPHVDLAVEWLRYVLVRDHWIRSDEPEQTRSTRRRARRRA